MRFSTSPTTSNPTLHRIALLTTLATFPLICIGSAVTTKDAGMSVPDWPRSYGYNMFLFPRSEWVGGILYEHSHRLMGTVVGFLSIILALAAWGPSETPAFRRKVGFATLLLFAATFFVGLIQVVVTVTQKQTVDNAPHLPAEVVQRLSESLVGLASVTGILFVAWLCRRREPSRAVRWLATSVLIAVCFQGLLGGLRVVLVNRDIAIFHACFAQATFCLVALVALVTSRLWYRLGQERRADAAGISLARLAVVASAVVYLQLILGATMRHKEAGLAISDLPLSYGKLLPPTNEDGLAAANAARARSGQPDLRPVSLTQIWLHFGHRLGALAVTCVLTFLIWGSLRDGAFASAVRGPALLLLPLLLLQLTLGVLTVLWLKPFEIASLHVAVGALVLLTTVLLTARAIRCFGLQRMLPVSASAVALAADAPPSAHPLVR